MEFLANILKGISIFGGSETVGCARFWLDEPEMPESMIEK